MSSVLNRRQASTFTGAVRLLLIGVIKCLILTVVLVIPLGCAGRTQEMLADVSEEDLVGKVVNAEGQPVLDASVRLICGHRSPGVGFMAYGLAPYPRLLPHYEMCKVATDRDGQYRIALPWFIARFDPFYSLVFSKAGYGTRRIEPFRYNRDAHSRVILAMEDRIAGTVVDEHGAPLSGVAVSPINLRIEMVGAFTRGDGTFEIVGVDRMESKALYARRSIHDIGVFYMLDTVPTWSDLRVILPIGKSKLIHLLDACNNPLPNTCVNIISYDRIPTKRIRWTEGLTNSNGSLPVTGITTEPLEALCEGKAVKVGLEPECFVQVPHVRSVPLIVLDSETGIGLSNIVVDSKNGPGGYYYLSKDAWRSGDKVTFVIGQWNLTIAAENYKPWCGTVNIDTQTSDIEIRLEPCH